MIFQVTLHPLLEYFLCPSSSPIKHDQLTFRVGDDFSHLSFLSVANVDMSFGMWYGGPDEIRKACGDKKSLRDESRHFLPLDRCHRAGSHPPGGEVIQPASARCVGSALELRVNTVPIV